MSCINYIATFTEKIKGYIKFHQCNKYKDTLVTFNLYGFEPNNIHACHIHEFGDLRKGCVTLGGHLNVKNKNHGSIFININESHTGDLLNNIKSDKDGTFNFYYHDPRINLFNNVNNSIIGCSVVIHYGKDDYGLGKDKNSKITGNAGERMACAIIGKMNPKF
jgi:Cu-Zn family superoxide dismutase